MSFCVNAIVAAKSAVASPIIITNSNVAGERAYNKLFRAIMYTPAVTIVAAWISADTGVGPAMASGSQVYKGICALLPIAPIKRRMVIVVRIPESIDVAFENTSRY